MAKASALALLAGMALALAACGPAEGVGSEPTTTMPAAVSASSGAVSTSSPAETAPATSSENPTAEAEPTVLPTEASVTIFYVAVGDGGASGPIGGCGDSLVAATSPTITFTDPVEGALRTLLKNHEMEVGDSGLLNALWQSNLTVTSVDRSASPIVANLEGTLKLGGECDNPRVQLQLLLTAQQAAGVPIDVTINGRPMAEALSLK